MSEGPISSDFPYDPRHVDVLGSRMCYVDEGSGPPVLFLHGNPTSSYLWRNVLPHLTGVARCIAPDLIGMGGSDKPDLPYRFFDHARYVDGFIEAMALERFTLVMHDWGSGLGLHFAARHPERVAGIVMMESILRPMRWKDFPPDFGIGFRLMRAPGVGYALVSLLNIFVNQVLPAAVVRKMTPEEMAHYRRPFRRVADRKPVRRWPQEIPIDGKPSDVTAVVEAYSRWLTESDAPKLLFYAHPGGIVREETVAWCRAHMPNLTAVDLGEGIHYLQEDHPHAIGEGIRRWMEASGLTA